MKNKTFLSMLTGYIAGMYVMTKYKNNKGKEVTPQVAMKDMADVHQKMFSDFSTWVESEEAAKMMADWKKVFEEVANNFPAEAKKRIEQLQKDGIVAKDRLEKEAKKLLEEKKDQVEKMKGHALVLYKDIQGTVKETVDETLKRLEDDYEAFIKKIKEEK